MILRSDDDIYIVDQRWYGPPGRTLPWAARYAAYGWGFTLYVLAMLVEREVLRIALSPQSVLFTLIGVALLTTHLMRKVNPDKPMLTVIRGYWQELRAPRPVATSQRRARSERRRMNLRLARAPRQAVPRALEARLSTHPFRG